MTRFGFRFRFVPMTALLSVVAFTGLAAGAAAAERSLTAASAVTAGPVITGAGCSGGQLIVTGQGFTPGGQVDVEISGSGITDPVFGPNGSVDPALGYWPGSLSDLGDSSAVVVYSVRASQTMFGRNASIDPALGFEPGGDLGFAVGYDCRQTATVRAYDRQLAAWSDQLPVLASGQGAR